MAVEAKGVFIKRSENFFIRGMVHNVFCLSVICLCHLSAWLPALPEKVFDRKYRTLSSQRKISGVQCHGALFFRELIHPPQTDPEMSY